MIIILFSDRVSNFIGDFFIGNNLKFINLIEELDMKLRNENYLIMINEKSNLSLIKDFDGLNKFDGTKTIV